MNLQEMEYITAIADCGSITVAAAFLHISQPALSKYLTSVERRLGCTLFHRTGKPIQPTQYGLLYLEKARQILAIGEQFRRELSDMTDGTVRKAIRIGIQSLRAPQLLPCILAAFEELLPDCRPVISEGNRSELIEMLRNDEADLLLTNDISLPEEWMRIVLRQDKLLLVSGSQNPPCSVVVPGEPYPVADLSLLENRTFLLLNSQNSVHHLAMRVLANSGIHPQIRSGIGNHVSTINVAALGTELSFTLDSYYESNRFLAPVLAYQILQEPNTVPYVLCCKPGAFPQGELTAFHRVLAAAAEREQAAINSRKKAEER